MPICTCGYLNVVPHGRPAQMQLIVTNWHHTLYTAPHHTWGMGLTWSQLVERMWGQKTFAKRSGLSAICTSPDIKCCGVCNCGTLRLVYILLSVGWVICWVSNKLRVTKKIFFFFLVSKMPRWAIIIFVAIAITLAVLAAEWVGIVRCVPWRDLWPISLDSISRSSGCFFVWCVGFPWLCVV